MGSTRNLDLFLRRRGRFTQRDIADKLHCSVSSVSDFENDHRPLPRGMEREDYERVLFELESELRASVA